MYIYFVCSYCSIFLINIEYKTRRILPLFFANFQNENFHDCTWREKKHEKIYCFPLHKWWVVSIITSDCYIITISSRPHWNFILSLSSEILSHRQWVDPWIPYWRAFHFLRLTDAYSSLHRMDIFIFFALTNQTNQTILIFILLVNEFIYQNKALKIYKNAFQ